MERKPKETIFLRPRLWRNLMALVACSLLLPVLLPAGQSLVLSPVYSQTVTDPTYPSNQSFRVEYQLHGLVAPPAGVYSQKLFSLSGVGIYAIVYPDGSLNMTQTRNSVDGGAACGVSSNNSPDVLVRFQLDLAQNRVTCELWNYDGTGYNSRIYPLQGLIPGYSFSGGNIGIGATGNLGFLRVATTVLPLGSRPPTTADAGDWTELKFDGNLRDSSGHNHGASGSASFIPTPDQVPVALPKTKDAPSWSNWVSLRAGFPAQLDGTASYSLADGSSSVSYFWQQQRGPSTVVWANRTNAVPTLTGLIFGTYTFSLRVTDLAGTSSVASIQVGAVATDNNGVVVNANPNVDKIFGPMIAFGRNPWGYMDQRAIAATNLRTAAYNRMGINPPSWATALPGTVSYRFAGATTIGALFTTLCAPITSNLQSTVTVCDASKLDLSVLPTRILIGTFPQEEIRICSASGNVLTVCYDGRGIAPGASNDGYRAAGQAWPNGTPAGQSKVTGTGTSFNTTLCPAGATGVAPFPLGTVSYSTGTVTVRAGLSSAAGVGTSWSTANGVIQGYSIRIQATHGGTPFSFLARINSVNSATDITMNRVFPADADPGTYTYQIVISDIQLPSLHYNRSDGSDGQIFWSSNGCESDTQLYLTASHDVGGLNGTQQNGRQYSVTSMAGYAGAFGVNFYGEDLAHRALYYRSGWAPALAAANMISDQWATSPYTAGGDAGGNPLTIGGGVIGAIAAAVIDNRVSWPNLRGFMNNAAVPPATNCNYDDTRDLSYYYAWVALGAQFDPDTSVNGFRAKWQAKLASIYPWEINCKRADNSWANAAFKGVQGAAVHVVSGSATATGTGFNSATCYGVTSGTITVVHGSAAATGTGFINSSKIVIEGTSGGSPFSGFYRYQLNSAASLTLAVLWPGDSGTFPYVIENNDNLTSIGATVDDPQLQKTFGCSYVSPTTLTLSRPWDGPTETAYLWQGILPGYSQQPFMMGIKANELRWASQVSTVNPTGFATLLSQAATWMRTSGYDPVTQGLFYGRVIQACEPVTTPAPAPQFDSRTPGCNDGLIPGYLEQARTLTAEASAAISAYYLNNPTPDNRTWGDTLYGSLWGYGPFTAPGYYSDPYQGSNQDDNNLGSYKWTGFHFGMGMAHQWPAVRVGGVAPATPRTVYVSFDQAAGATARMIVTAPSGAATTYTCGSTSPCSIQVDDRQGAHWLQVQYLSAGGDVISRSAPQLLTASR